MGRPKKNGDGDRLILRFAPGSLARIDATLADKETRSDLIRGAVEKEVKARERKQAKAP